jgi:hypothetical protein
VSVRSLAARLDTLVGEFVALHSAMLMACPSRSSADAALARLFGQPVLGPVESVITPYADISPGVKVGFEPGANVTMTVRPKEDFCRSPDSCINTFAISYSGSSRFLTIEVALAWEDLQGTERFQLGVYARPSRNVSCRSVVRLAAADDAHTDARLVDFALSPDARAFRHSGPIVLAEKVVQSRDHAPRLILFFDTEAELTLHFDYLTVHFG